MKSERSWREYANPAEARRLVWLDDRIAEHRREFRKLRDRCCTRKSRDERSKQHDL